MASQSNLRDLLELELKDTYSAETQLTKALPKMAKSATDPELRAGFEQHLKETENHVHPGRTRSPEPGRPEPGPGIRRPKMSANTPPDGCEV